MLKWTYGEPQPKTPLARAPAPPQAAPIEDNVCLQTINKSTCVEIVKEKNRDRADLYERMNSRDLTPQIGLNPFQQRNYSEDIEIQDRFLKGKGL